MKIILSIHAKLSCRQVLCWISLGVVWRCAGIAKATITLQFVKEVIFKLLSLVMVYLGYETKAHNEVFKVFWLQPTSSLVASWLLCIFFFLFMQQHNNIVLHFLPHFRPAFSNESYHSVCTQMSHPPHAGIRWTRLCLWLDLHFVQLLCPPLQET